MEGRLRRRRGLLGNLNRTGCLPDLMLLDLSGVADERRDAAAIREALLTLLSRPTVKRVDGWRQSRQSRPERTPLALGIWAPRGVGSDLPRSRHPEPYHLVREIVNEDVPGCCLDGFAPRRDTQADEWPLSAHHPDDAVVRGPLLRSTSARCDTIQ